jgi:hypothetical protein
MNWHSIIFSGKMVRAIIAEKKSQTRRVLKKQPKVVVDGKAPYTWEVSGGDFSKSKILKCPYGKPGDFLWVKEKYALSLCDPETPEEDRDIKNSCIWDHPVYAATDKGGEWCMEEVVDEGLISKPIDAPWRNPVFMPRWVSRIYLKIVNIDIKRLHDISEQDIIDEGIFLPPLYLGAINGEPVENDSWWDAERKEMKDPWSFFSEEWDIINAKRGYPWKDNHWVWAIKFKIHEIFK